MGNIFDFSHGWANKYYWFKPNKVVSDSITAIKNNDITFGIMSGKHDADCIGSSLAIEFYSDKLIKILEENNISFEKYLINVDAKIKLENKYYYVEFKNRIPEVRGNPDKYCKEHNIEKKYIKKIIISEYQFYGDFSKWDGKDLFTIDGRGYVFITDKLKSIFKKMKLKNIECDNYYIPYYINYYKDCEKNLFILEQTPAQDDYQFFIEEKHQVYSFTYDNTEYKSKIKNNDITFGISKGKYDADCVFCLGGIFFYSDKIIKILEENNISFEKYLINVNTKNKLKNKYYYIEFKKIPGFRGDPDEYCKENNIEKKYIKKIILGAYNFYGDFSKWDEKDLIVFDGEEGLLCVTEKLKQYLKKVNLKSIKCKSYKNYVLPDYPGYDLVTNLL